MNVEDSTQKVKKKFNLKPWLKKHRLAVALVAGSTLVLGTFIGALIAFNPNISEVAIVKPKPKPVKYYSPLTGKQVGSGGATTQAVTAVMIENSPDARPQSGLKEAGVVYEAVAEGGITRFVALYQQEKPQLVGPVRSLRMYYLDWAAPYSASIAHVGGSPNALAEVSGSGYRDIDQYFNSEAYWRSTDRYAPHNMYTSFERLDKLNASKKYTESQFTSFDRADAKKPEKPSVSNITVNFSSHTFNTSYTYNAGTNTYNRFLAGEPHNDREHGQISPDVVVVIKVTTMARENNIDGYEDIVTTGSGQAYIFQNGTAEEVTWSKAGRKDPLKLTKQDGKPAVLNRGQTWVSAITGRGDVSWQ